MDLIELIFKLIMVHVPMNQEDFARLYNEAKDWKMDVSIESENKIKAMYAKIHKPWLVRLIMAVAYIPLTRLITTWKMAAEDSSEV